MEKQLDAIDAMLNEILNIPSYREYYKTHKIPEGVVSISLEKVLSKQTGWKVNVKTLNKRKRKSTIQTLSQ